MAAHERLGEVLRILRTVLERYAPLQSTELFMAAGALILMLEHLYHRAGAGLRHYVSRLGAWLRQYVTWLWKCVPQPGTRYSVRSANKTP